MTTHNKAAERMKKRHDEVSDVQGAGGVLEFNHLGYGGKWYETEEQPARAAIIVPVIQGHVGIRAMQALVDEWEKSYEDHLKASGL